MIIQPLRATCFWTSSKQGYPGQDFLFSESFIVYSLICNLRCKNRLENTFGLISIIRVSGFFDIEDNK